MLLGPSCFVDPMNLLVNIFALYFCLTTTLSLREKHIGAYKSQVAAQQAGQLNPVLRNRVRGLTLKVGPETESVFDAAFWRDTDVVVTALVSFMCQNRLTFLIETLSDVVVPYTCVCCLCLHHRTTWRRASTWTACA